MTQAVRWLAGCSVGRLVLKGGILLFHAPIRELACSNIGPQVIFFYEKINFPLNLNVRSIGHRFHY